MPIYEYGCAACGTAFSRLRPIVAATEPAACPVCGGAAERGLSRFAIGGRAAPPVEVAPTTAPAAGPELCQRYPQIPLLCHMETRAAARWIAKARGHEEQFLEREARREHEREAAGLPPETAPVHPAHQVSDHIGHVHTPLALPAAEG